MKFGGSNVSPLLPKERSKQFPSRTVVDQYDVEHAAIPSVTSYRIDGFPRPRIPLVEPNVNGSNGDDLS